MGFGHDESQWHYNGANKQGFQGIFVLKQVEPEFVKSPRPKSSKSYYYPNRDGSSLLRVNRIDKGDGKKDFYQQHWDGSKWVNGNPDHIKRLIPIYRYSEVQQAIQKKELIFYDKDYNFWKTEKVDKRDEEPTPPAPMLDCYFSDFTIESIGQSISDRPDDSYLVFVDKFEGKGWITARDVGRWWSSAEKLSAENLRLYMASVVDLGYASSNGESPKSRKYQILISKNSGDNGDKSPETVTSKQF